jgi:hypothetical protein
VAAHIASEASGRTIQVPQCHRWMARRAHKESGCGADKHWHSAQVRRAEQGMRREVGSRDAWTREPGGRHTVQAHRLHGLDTSEHVCEGAG